MITCFSCNSVFSTPRDVIDHFKSHLLENVSFFICIECNKTYSNLNSLISHLNRNHTNINQTARTENENLKKKSNPLQFDLTTKFELKNLKFVFCIFCGTKFIDIENLISHMKCAHNATMQFRKTDCNFACSSHQESVIEILLNCENKILSHSLILYSDDSLSRKNVRKMFELMLSFIKSLFSDIEKNFPKQFFSDEMITLIKYLKSYKIPSESKFFNE